MFSEQNSNQTKQYQDGLYQLQDDESEDEHNQIIENASLSEQQQLQNIQINIDQQQLKSNLEKELLLQQLLTENSDLKRKNQQFDSDVSSIIIQLNQEIAHLYGILSFDAEQRQQLEKSNTDMKEEIIKQQQANEEYQKQIDTLRNQNISISTSLNESIYFIDNCQQLLRNVFQNRMKDVNIIKYPEQLDLPQNIESYGHRLKSFENKLTLIVDNLDKMNLKINLSQYNVNELLHIKSLIESQLEIDYPSTELVKPQESLNFQQDQEQCYESTQVITPLSTGKKEIVSQVLTSTKQDDFSKFENQAQELQLIEKNQIIESLQTQLQEAEQIIENMKFKQTEQHLLDIIVTDRQQECQTKLQQQFKIVQELQANEKMKALELQNFELKIKLEALQEIAKENVRLKRKQAYFEIQKFHTEIQASPPSKNQTWNSKTIQKSFQSFKNNRNSTEKNNGAINTDHFQLQVKVPKQPFLDSEQHQAKKQVEHLKKVISEQSSKLFQEKELIKQCLILLNNLITDLKKKINQMNLEEFTKKKTVVGFIEKIHQSIGFVVNKLQLGKSSEYQSPLCQRTEIS